MKKILIPTDFSIKSLNVVHSVVAHFNEPIEVILFHAVYIGDSISDLLFAGRKVTKDYTTPDYNEACEILKNKYASSISRIRTVFFYGSTVAVFNNFLEGNNIDSIVINSGHEYQLKHKHSIDPLPLIHKSRIKPLSLSGSKRPLETVDEDKATLLELLVSA
jgi:hypothetical protein